MTRDPTGYGDAQRVCGTEREMKDTNYHVFTLDNGLRCVHRHTDSGVSYSGVAIDAGSRDEPDDKPGLAHFVEHTIFKGTRKRRSWNISNRMESVGGELNAYTSKEETVIYTNAPAGHTPRALELLGDLIAGATFPAAEIEREREVVIEEINSYLDSPGDCVYDELEDMIYAGSGLGHNILGTPQSVRALDGTDCRSYVDRFYTPGNMTLYVADSSTPAQIERLAARHFGSLRHPHTPKTRKSPGFIDSFHRVEDRDGHQAHTIVASRTFGRNDPRRFPLFLLNNMLAGPCMNSRLNQELREKRGLVYTVDSSVSLMSDAGLLQIYFGSDRSTVARCRRLIERELTRLASDTLSPAAFERARRQYIGQLIVSSDNRESYAMALGKSLLYYGEVHDPVWTARRMEEVTAAQVRDVAQLLAPSLCSSLTIC